MNFPDISIIIPAFNESKRLPPYLKQWMEFLPNRFDFFEVIVIDDGSIDNLSLTLSKFSEFKTVIVKVLPQNMGKGFAVKSGMEIAQGHLKLFCDADGATPVEELNKLIKTKKENDADIVIGSRINLVGVNLVKSNLFRHYLGRVFTTLSFLVSGLDIYDTQCGFKLFSKKSADLLFPNLMTNGYTFDIEILMRANKMKFKICEVPINWNNQAGSKVNVFLDGLKMIYELIVIKNFLIK